MDKAEFFKIFNPLLEKKDSIMKKVSNLEIQLEIAKKEMNFISELDMSLNSLNLNKEVGSDKIFYSFVKEIDKEKRYVEISETPYLHLPCPTCNNLYPVISRKECWEEGAYEDPDFVIKIDCYIPCPEHGFNGIYHQQISH
ncbi:hypothetical protein A3K82_00815 [Candidatus Pacearchaeota archaeon RBG_19FT_COMBO_34_9]|nr:MAG: hypothetical protein A3K82_00815 [Candidatus Pacearchaeota archaeon RBG_19FT_COMBO_34_9]OGJ16562.1 MAG: hypothetical protein A3K74_00460 [Candidatus Pacearchaeota archaeon RBG_13_33_26]